MPLNLNITLTDALFTLTEMWPGHRKETMSNLKILLLQIRQDEETALEEYLEFVQNSELLEKNFTSLNPCTNPEFDPSIIDDYDALFVGGSSDATVMKPDLFPFVESCKKLVRYSYENDVPVFASCFGFQLAVEEFGGEIILDKANMEVGSYEIFLNDEAKKDLLFHDTPSPFYAICGHKERAKKVPPDSTLLAYSELCPIHSFKMNNKIFYAFQFHPEVDKKDLMARITRYRDRYFGTQEEFEALMKKVSYDTPDSNILVKKFVDRFLR